jgi:hypothetical protein
MSKLVLGADQQTIAWLGSRQITGWRANKVKADGCPSRMFTAATELNYTFS